MKWIDIWQDLDRNLLGTPRSLPSVLKLLVTARYRSVLGFRIAQWLGKSGLTAVADIAKQANQRATGADVSWRADIGPGMILYHPVGVVVGPDCVIGQNSTFQQGVTIGGRGEGGGPIIGDEVFLGAGAKVLGSVGLGNQVMVGANAVVLRDIPAGKTAVGVPAKWSD